MTYFHRFFRTIHGVLVTVFHASYYLFVLMCLFLRLVLLHIQVFSTTWANVAAVLVAIWACSLTFFVAPAIFQLLFQHFISYTLFNCLSKQVLIFELVPFWIWVQVDDFKWRSIAVWLKDYKSIEQPSTLTQAGMQSAQMQPILVARLV